MKLNEVKNFDNLWEMSELVSNKIHNNFDNEQIIEDITNNLNEYCYLDSKKLSKEISSPLKEKYIGRILFLLTHLSLKDNVNVYTALKNELIENSK